MKQKIKTRVIASALSFVLLLNFLLPNTVQAKDLAFADRVQNSNSAGNNHAIRPQFTPVVVLVVFIVVATVKGLGKNNSSTQTNLNNLD